jgi:hypothetical protein
MRGHCGLEARATLLLLLLLLAGFAHAGDVLTLKNGRTADCRIISFSPTTVKILWQEREQRDIPLADVEFITFAPHPGEAETLAKAVAEGRGTPLIQLWIAKSPRLAIPRSNAGEIGLTYAELLTREASAGSIERAVKVYEQIESTDWSHERRGRAKVGKLRLLLRQGRGEEMKPQAQAMLKEAKEARVKIELHHLMAEAAAVQLRALVRDHPRWELEDDIRPQRDRLFHAALDAYLFPHVFHGAEEDLAARGLWAAAQLSREHGDTDSARAAAADLVQLYPESPEKAAAAGLLKELPAKEPEAAAEEPDIPNDPEK